MFTVDPIQHAEKVVRTASDTAGKYTQPALKRYPLTFLFLVTFSVVAILHGFELLTDDIVLFQEHPVLLIALGVFMLFLTGMLYKVLQRGR